MEAMSRSLNPQYDGLAFGLASGRKENLTSSVDYSSLMSRSFAGFHLNLAASGPQTKNIMHQSIDKLFEGSAMLDTQSSIILEESTGSLPGTSPKPRSPLPGETTPPTSSHVSMTTSTPMDNAPHRRSVSSPQRSDSPNHNTSQAAKTDSTDSDVRNSSDLFVEYQKQRMRIEEEMAEQAKRQLLRQQLQMDVAADDNRLTEVKVSDTMKGKLDLLTPLVVSWFEC